MEMNEIILYKLKMRMKNPFTTSFGTEQDGILFVSKGKRWQMDVLVGEKE